MAIAQRGVYRTRFAGRVAAPGDHERGQQRGVEALVRPWPGVAGEVHERQPSVGLGDTVLEARGDPELLDLDRECELGELGLGECDGVQRAQGPQGGDDDRARTP